MKNVTKVLIAVVAGLTGVLQMPAVQSYLASVAGRHVHISELLVAIGVIASLVHNPSTK